MGKTLLVENDIIFNAYNHIPIVDFVSKKNKKIKFSRVFHSTFIQVTAA